MLSTRRAQWIVVTVFLIVTCARTRGTDDPQSHAKLSGQAHNNPAVGTATFPSQSNGGQLVLPPAGMDSGSPPGVKMQFDNTGSVEGPERPNSRLPMGRNFSPSDGLRLSAFDAQILRDSAAELQEQVRALRESRTDDYAQAWASMAILTTWVGIGVHNLKRKGKGKFLRELACFGALLAIANYFEGYEGVLINSSTIVAILVLGPLLAWSIVYYGPAPPQ